MFQTILGIVIFMNAQIALGQDSRILLEWDDYSNNEDGFVIELKNAHDSNWTVLDSVSQNTTSFDLSGMNLSDSVMFRVYAYRGVFRSDYSESISSSALSSVMNDKQNLSDNSDRVVTPDQFELLPNYPNPFNPTTTIPFTLDKMSEVSLSIYNIRGQKIRSLVNGEAYSDGYYEMMWDGRDENNQAVSSDVYFACLETEGFRSMRKITLMR